jgi:VWA-like domain (DUF2201)
MPQYPFSHHEIIRLLASYTELGRSLELKRSDRQERRLVFQPLRYAQTLGGFSPRHTEFAGCGDTNFTPLLKAAENTNPDRIIVLADLDGPTHVKPSQPVIWTIHRPILRTCRLLARSLPSLKASPDTSSRSIDLRRDGAHQVGPHTKRQNQQPARGPLSKRLLELLTCEPSQPSPEPLSPHPSATASRV